MPRGGRSPSAWRPTRRRTRSCSACRAAACRSPPRSRARWARRSTSSSCASSARPATRSSASAPSRGRRAVFDRRAVRRPLASPASSTERGAPRAARARRGACAALPRRAAALDVDGRTVDPRRRRPGDRRDGAGRAARGPRARRRGGSSLAVPVGAPETVAALQAEADDVVCVLTPDRSGRSASGTEDFRPDDRRRGAWRCSPRRAPERGARPDDAAPAAAAEVDDPASGPASPCRRPERPAARAPGVVVFAHGSGSSRHSPRNR